MRQLIKQILLIAFLLSDWQMAYAFSLQGAVADGAGGTEDAWQTPTIGYADAYGPKKWGEGYRINTPYVYYAWDATFLAGFDTNNAPAAIDSAFAIMNSLTNVSSMSADLSEFPLDTRQQNYLGYSLGLVDLKTMTLFTISQQIGLIDPVPYVWTLHDWTTAVGESCPAGQLFTVVQRNYDPLSLDPNATVYSPYINGALYTYEILFSCTPQLADTFNYTLDPYADAYSPVASSELKWGDYFTGLTRDDVMGLKTLISSNNVVLEDAPLGSFELVTNALPPAPLVSTNYGAFLSQVLTNNPATLLTNFPGLDITYTATNYGPFVFTNISLYYSNQTVLPFYTNYVRGGLTNGYYFTNQPGPTVVNYDNTNFTILTTMDLGLFVDQALTNDPVTLQALYPNLVILDYSVLPVYMTVTNYVSYLTNITGSPYGDPVPVTVIASITSAYATNWLYTFGNVITNHFYTNRFVTIQNIFSEPMNGAPYPNPIVIQTNVTHYYTNLISGDFFLIPTNWCGFDVTQAHPLSIMPPYTYSYTNTIIYGGLNTNNTATGTTNLPSSSVYGYIRNYLNSSTNYIYVVYPGICEPVLTLATNYSTNLFAEYSYSFGNIMTNTYSTSTFVTVIITNITPVFGGTNGQLATNVTVASYYTNFPSGDFVIIPPGLCGFNILSTYFTNTIYVTNTFVVTNSNPAFTNAGQFSETIISQYTNHTYLAEELVCSNFFPVPEARRGIEKIQFIRGDYDSDSGQFFVWITNTFHLTTVTNHQDVVETFQRVITQPDLKFAAEDLVTLTPLGLGGPVNPLMSVTNGFHEPALISDTGAAGPGTKVLEQTIIFNDGGPVLYHDNDDAPLNGQSYFDGYTYSNLLFSAYHIWASYDGSTNLPVLYPPNLRAANLGQQLVIEVTPLYLPDGTNGVAYNVPFTAAGGQPPYTWSLSGPTQSVLPAGLTLTGTTIAGTPTGVLPGLYDFQLIITDSAGRVVQLSYSITIH